MAPRLLRGFTRRPLPPHAPHLGHSYLDPAPGWGKAVIYLQTCLVASPGRGRAQGGDVVGRRLAGLEQGLGMGVRRNRPSGWSCLPLRCWGPRHGLLPDPRRGVRDNARNRRHCASPQGLPEGHVRGSSEVRAESAAVQPCHTTRRAPAMTAAVAGGSWPSNGSPPSGFSPCADSFAVARWLAGGDAGQFSAL